MSDFNVGTRCCWTQTTFTLGQRGMKCCDCQKVMTVVAWEEKRRCRCNSTNTVSSIASNNISADRINIPRANPLTNPVRARRNTSNTSIHSSSSRSHASITPNNIFTGITAFNIFIIILALVILVFIVICLGAYFSHENLARNSNPISAVLAGAIIGPIAWIEISIVFILFFLGFIFGQIPLNHDNLALIGLHFTILFGTSLTWGCSFWLFIWQLINEYINNFSRR